MNVDLLIKENNELSKEKQRYKEMWFTANDSLAKYRNIEKELGCPLEVVFQALKNGVYKIDDNLCYEVVLRIHNDEIYLCQPYDDKLLHKVYIKDYKKTWWLKANRSK